MSITRRAKVERSSLTSHYWRRAAIRCPVESGVLTPQRKPLSRECGNTEVKLDMSHCIDIGQHGNRGNIEGKLGGQNARDRNEHAEHNAHNVRLSLTRDFLRVAPMCAALVAVVQKMFSAAPLRRWPSRWLQLRPLRPYCLHLGQIAQQPAQHFRQ